MNNNSSSSVNRIFSSRESNELKGGDRGVMHPAEVLVPASHPASSSVPPPHMNQEGEIIAGPVDVIERLDRIEKRLEDIVRPLLLIRSTAKKLLARVEELERNVRRIEK